MFSTGAYATFFGHDRFLFGPFSAVLAHCLTWHTWKRGPRKKNLKKGLQHKEKTHVLLLMEEILLASWYGKYLIIHRANISLFTGFDMFYTSQVVQDLFHQQ